MRMKKIVENRTLKGAAAEFLAFKRAQKIRERTLHDYEKYINPFIEQSSNAMDVDVLKKEILEYFADIPKTSPARFNHPASIFMPFCMGGKGGRSLPENKQLTRQGIPCKMILNLCEQKEVIVMKKRNGAFPGNAAAFIAAAVSLLCYFDNSGGLPGGSGLSGERVIPFSSVETAAAEQSDQHVRNFQRYQEPLLDYPTEIWDTTGPGWEVLPYNTVDAISVDLYYKGFIEIDFCGAIQPDPYNNLGACTMRNIVYTSDGTHFQIEFTHVTNVGTWREVSLDYIFRAEHTGELVDISSVGNPDAESIGEPLNSLAGTKSYMYGLKCEEGDSELIDVSLFYSRATGNMYSLTKRMTFEALDKIITRNDGQSYDPRFLYPYNPDGPYAILFPINNPSTYELTVAYPDTGETKIYTFKIGSTYKEWVYSSYNTDGWRVDPKDNTRIISADGYYSLPADKKVTPSITAKAVS